MRAPPPYRPVLTRGMLPASTWQVRQKEKQLKELQPGGASHNPRPFVDKKKFSFRFPPSPRCAPEVIELEGVAQARLPHGLGRVRVEERHDAPRRVPEGRRRRLGQPVVEACEGVHRPTPLGASAHIKVAEDSFRLGARRGRT